MAAKTQIQSGESLSDAVQTVSFADLLDHKRSQESVGFTAYGNLSKQEPEAPVEETPEFSTEELQQRRLEQLERETYQRVYEAAEQAGMEMGMQKMEALLAERLPELESILRQLDGLPARIFAASEQFLVETAITLVRQLHRHELAINHQSLAARVKRLLNEVAEKDQAVVHVAPESAEILKRIKGFQQLTIQEDAAIVPGSVRVESSFGGVEEDLEGQLQEMETNLHRFLHERLRAVSPEVAQVAALAAHRRLERARVAAQRAAEEEEVFEFVSASPEGEAAPAHAETSEPIVEQQTPVAPEPPSGPENGTIGQTITPPEMPVETAQVRAPEPMAVPESPVEPAHGQENTPAPSIAPEPEIPVETALESTPEPQAAMEPESPVESVHESAPAAVIEQEIPVEPELESAPESPVSTEPEHPVEQPVSMETEQGMAGIEASEEGSMDEAAIVARALDAQARAREEGAEPDDDQGEGA
ncbi:MAG: hypothetical protein HQL50_02390 [Magnetococcales bacterium]|nr:hypothetical protein [Magnetococcales bacterium]